MPETTLRCIRYLRDSDPDAKISVEVERPGREGLPELAAEADVVFYSKTWAEVWSMDRLSPQKLTLPQDQGYRTADECLEAQRGVARKA